MEGKRLQLNKYSYIKKDELEIFYLVVDNSDEADGRVLFLENMLKMISSNIPELYIKFVPADIKWININDKLPTSEVIAIGHQEEMLIGYVGWDKDQECYSCENDGGILEQVTHWMPKPEPPKH